MVFIINTVFLVKFYAAFCAKNYIEFMAQFQKDILRSAIIDVLTSLRTRLQTNFQETNNIQSRHDSETSAILFHYQQNLRGME